jgi:hypothetical protein
VIAVDVENKILAFWRFSSAFQVGIYSFDEVKGASWEKDGDVVKTSVHSAGPISIPRSSTKKGKTSVNIETNRISQPNFSFGVNSPGDAKDLTQRLSIAMDWV